MADNDPAEKPLWTPAFRDLIPDQYVVQEFDRLAAYLRTLGNTQTTIQIERQIETSDPPDPKKDNPDTTVKPEDGVRWLKGPHVLNADNDIALAKGSAAFSVSVTGGTYNDWGPDGIDSAIMVLIKPYGSAVSLTGIKRKARQTRFLTLVNYGSVDLKLINQSTGSNAVHRFSWGTSGDTGETLTIPTGMGVTLIYNTQGQRWMLSAVPPVGTDNLPPSLTTPESNMPPWYYWRATMVTDPSMTLVSTLNANAAYIGAAGVTFVNEYGFGATRQTGNVDGNVEGVQEPAASGIFTLHNPTTDMLIRTGADITNVRIWAMLLNGGTSFDSDTIGGGAHHGAGFRYSTVAGDPGWVGVTGDGTGSQTVSAKVADIAAATRYRLRIRVEGSTIYFSVDGGTEVAMTTTLPDTQTLLRWRIAVVTKSAAVRELTFFRTWQRGGFEPS